MIAGPFWAVAGPLGGAASAWLGARWARRVGQGSRTLGARHVLHWTELVGGDIVLTIPFSWQKQFNASGIEPVERMHLPVDQHIVDELYEKFPVFRRAYDVDGLSPEEFDTFGPTVRTLRAFIESYHQLQGAVREFMLPNPDLR